MADINFFLKEPIAILDTPRIPYRVHYAHIEQRCSGLLPSVFETPCPICNQGDDFKKLMSQVHMYSGLMIKKPPCNFKGNRKQRSLAKYYFLRSRFTHVVLSMKTPVGQHVKSI